MTGEEKDAHDRRAGRGHQHGSGRDILRPTDHRMVLWPGVIDQDFQGGVEELGGDHHRKAEDEGDELDDGKAQHQRCDQDNRGGDEMDP